MFGKNCAVDGPGYSGTDCGAPCDFFEYVRDRATKVECWQAGINLFGVAIDRAAPGLGSGLASSVNTSISAGTGRPDEAGVELGVFVASPFKVGPFLQIATTLRSLQQCLAVE